MDLRQPRTFVAIAETGSLSAAASTLPVTHSALSRQVSALEEDCRGKLMERGPSGILLAQAGECLLVRARDLLAEAAGAISEVSDLNAEPMILTGPPGDPRLQVRYFRLNDLPDMPLILPASVVRQDLTAGTLSGAPIEDFTLLRVLAVVRDRPLGRAAQAVAEAIRAETANIVANGAFGWRAAEPDGRKRPYGVPASPRSHQIPV